MSEELFTEDWYAQQFSQLVEKKEPWAVYLQEQLEKQMRYYLNQPPLFMRPLSGLEDRKS